VVKVLVLDWGGFCGGCFLGWGCGGWLVVFFFWFLVVGVGVFSFLFGLWFCFFFFFFFFFCFCFCGVCFFFLLVVFFFFFLGGVWVFVVENNSRERALRDSSAFEAKWLFFPPFPPAARRESRFFLIARIFA